MNGFLVIDKPAGITSHDVVAAVRRVTGVKKVGHTGTLDPFATGVLPLALGRSTRLIQFLDESIKVYDATIRFGTSTNTGDPTGEVTATAELPDADEAAVIRVLDGFLGEREQEPHAFSAVKVAGKPMYHYARKGQTVKVRARTIFLHQLDLLSYDRETLRLRITCSRGTYARVLADEIALALDSVGHLSALCRDRSGPFYLDDAVGLDTVAGYVAAEEGHGWKAVLMGKRGDPRVPWRSKADVIEALTAHVRSELRSLDHLPLADVTPPDAERVRHGGHPPPPPRGLAMGDRYLVVCGESLVAVAENSHRGPKLLRVA